MGEGREELRPPFLEIIEDGAEFQRNNGVDNSTPRYVGRVVCVFVLAVIVGSMRPASLKRSPLGGATRSPPLPPVPPGGALPATTRPLKSRPFAVTLFDTFSSLIFPLYLYISFLSSI